LTQNTVYENLSFFAEIKGVHKDKIDSEIKRVMSRLKLTSFQNTLVSQLSGGWKRKLSIAISLLNDPKIIIMDEPTSGKSKARQQ